MRLYSTGAGAVSTAANVRNVRNILWRRRDGRGDAAVLSCITAMEWPADAPTSVPAPARPTRRWLELSVFALLLGGALAAAALLGSARDGARPAGPRGFDVVRAKDVEPAPDFALTALDGSRVRLRDLRGRVVLLNFWATWCAPCRDEMPALARLGVELGDRGLAVLAVNHQEAPDVVAAFARELGVTVPVLLDSAGDVAERYRVQALPTTYLIGRDGTLAGVVLGYRRWDAPDARAYLEELLGRDRGTPGWRDDQRAAAGSSK
jgi:cytochrome c biogenesis protein CcmG, thiol:disulfide interchange protein DsbE